MYQNIKDKNHYYIVPALSLHIPNFKDKDP